MAAEMNPVPARDGAGMRIEHDSLGPVEVPADRLWGAQTQRSLHNLCFGGDRYRWRRSVIRAFGLVKACAAEVNAELGRLPQDSARVIAQAAREVADGLWDEDFPLGVFQTGSGTHSNMNANEVIANRAIQLAGGIVGSNAPIHPNDDVNCSQSSNDVFPTVMHLACVDATEKRLFPALEALGDTFDAQAKQFSGIVMIGRTHLQDAIPVTLGQVVSGWSAQLSQAREGIQLALAGLYELAIGGTAVGTGLNAPPEFGDRVAARLAAVTGRPFVSAANKFAALSAHDGLVRFSGSLRTLAGALMKIANDIRWYSSGPRSGIGELTIPENEPGSSIMPGKMNPSQCEALTMVAVQVFGYDHAVAFAGSQGNFQLNVFKPVMLYNALESIELLGEGCRSFRVHCAAGIAPNEPVIRQHVEQSLMLVTALSSHIGYERAAQIALMAHREHITLREAARRLGFVTDEQFDQWVRPEQMTNSQ